MYYKAFIKVVKSLSNNGHTYNLLQPVTVVKEPLIDAKDKTEVKEILIQKYPQFFQNNKIYEKETKDKAQFFYVLIYKLYNHEIKAIQEGEWNCEYCGHIHHNKYISRPYISPKFTDKLFCARDYDAGNDITHLPSCFDKWRKETYNNSNNYLQDDIKYIDENSLNYIYKITEKKTGKSYIGKTRNEPFFRWWNHLKHSESPFGIYLRQTKLSEWTFEVIEELPSNTKDADIFRIESEYIIKYDTINNGFNAVLSSKKAKKS